MGGTPLWQLLRGGIAAPDRVITGSNIPTAAEARPPTLLSDDPVAKPCGVFPNSSGPPAVGRVDPQIRTRFADTALWLPALKLDANGQADT